MKAVLCLLWLLYFLQGIPYGFQTKFLPVFLRSHSLSLSVITLTRLLSLPWILKPLWAPLVDKFGTKTTWITFNLFGMAFFYLFASCISLNILLTLAVVGGLNILASTQDIAVDSIIVDLLSTHDIGTGNIAQVVGYKTGSLVGGGLLGWLSSSFPWQHLFFLLFLIYFLTAILILWQSFSKTSTLQSNIGKDQNISERRTAKNYVSQLEESLVKNQDNLRAKEERDTPQAPSIDDPLKNLPRKEHKNTTELKPGTVKKLHISSQQNDADYGKPQLNTAKNCEISGTNYLKHDVHYKKSDNVRKGNRLKSYYSIYRDILQSPGTKWTVLYVLVYKLGDQGIIAIFPMSLMDQGLPSSQTAVLTGVWCMACSILGSFLGGMMISSVQWSSLCNTLTTLSTARLIVASLLTWIDSVNTLEANWLSIVFFDCALHFVSGAITTVTFTLMVTCSQQCSMNVSATHYSTLATFEVLGKLIMISLSGSITETTGYGNFFLICVLLLIIPILLLKFLASLEKNRDKVKV